MIKATKGAAAATVALALAACGGPDANAPRGPHKSLPDAFELAFGFDAIAAPHYAVEPYLDTVRIAAANPDDAWQVPALEASLDALATQSLPDLGELSDDAALAYRTTDGAAIAAALARVETRGPFARSLIAQALQEMAERRGDATAAEQERARTGCARAAAVYGPTAWAPVLGVDEAGPLDRPDLPLPASVPRGDPFGTSAAAVVVRDRGCGIALSAESAHAGVREVVVDVDVPREELLGIAMRSHGAAILRAAGVRVLRRPFELGDGAVARFARVSSTAGTLRLVARVGTAKDDDVVEIDVTDADGRPLPSHAPAVGSTATARVAGAQPLAPMALHSNAELLLQAAAFLAEDDPREAERLLWPVATRADTPADLALVYGRANDAARDLSQAVRTERSRAAYEHVLEKLPASWEAGLAHAVLAGARRGRDEAGMEVLRDLEAQRAKAQVRQPVLDAFEGLTSGREKMFDRAAAALARARNLLAGTAILANAEYAAAPKSGAELAAALCDPARLLPQDSLACFNTLRATSDRAGAARELARLRALLGAPGLDLPVELRDALAVGDRATAARAAAAMLPAERTLSILASLDPPADVAAHLLSAAPTARDAPSAIDPLLRGAGVESGPDLDAIADRVAAEDRTSPILPNAATAVLVHTETYELMPTGLLRWRLFDVRRVSGTTDVQENAEASAPDVWGRGSARAVRRRILKHDGRVLDPEPTPRASQAGAELSQLEQGDVVEAVYEGWALPGETGDMGVDTPDLLPERTAVHDATIEIRLPASLKVSLWSHPLLGKPAETSAPGERVLTWRVADHPERRVEDGVPLMDRSARVSVATSTWAAVARSLRETEATLEDHDPEIAAWARGAAPGPGAVTQVPGQVGLSTRGTVEAIVEAAGKALRESDAGALSDYAGGVAAVQEQTARSFLSSHDGSRSWLILRALRELGIAADLVVAENAPFSADPAFPPHFGRFTHPLVVAHVDGKDVWIDADIQGPPLPAGRISPELRGRLALSADGAIAPLPPVGDRDEGDEVDMRLTLDDHGDAQGTFAVVLKGRDAQQLAESLVRQVGAERQRALRDVVLSWLPWANVQEVQLSTGEGSWQVGLRATITVTGYAQREGAKTWLLPGLDTLHASVPRAHVGSLAATFATKSDRQSALALSRAVQYHAHRRVELPAGTKVARTPGPLDVKAPLVEASRRIEVSGGDSKNKLLTIEDDFVLGVATGTVLPKDYEAFVQGVHTADDGFLAAERVTRP